MMSVQRPISASEVPLLAKQGTVREQMYVGWRTVNKGKEKRFKKKKKKQLDSLPCSFISPFSLICPISISVLTDIVYCWTIVQKCKYYILCTYCVWVCVCVCVCVAGVCLCMRVLDTTLSSGVWCQLKSMPGHEGAVATVQKLRQGKEGANIPTPPPLYHTQTRVYIYIYTHTHTHTHTHTIHTYVLKKNN